ncbi:MAG: hypothetical protein ACREM3_28445 [Candidatus Rokuibacteriota bacterium]
MKSSWTLVSTLTLALLASAVVPSLVAAEPNAVAYEVTENLRLGPLKRGQRIATAVLSGKVRSGTSVCPSWIVAQWGTDHCVLTATATDSISLKTGVGPVAGTFQVKVQDDNPVDGAEVVILHGTLRGRIDLSMALLGGMPLGTLEHGRWSARGVRGGPLEGVRAGGTLTGTFRLPFNMALPTPFGCHFDGDFSDCTGQEAFDLYLQDSGVPVPVALEEYSLGMPTVKLEITFEDRD